MTSHPHSQPGTEQDYLEDNIATVAYHMGRPGARLSIAYDDGPKLIVDPGEVLKEASRRLTPSVASPSLPDRETIAQIIFDFVDASEANLLAAADVILSLKGTIQP